MVIYLDTSESASLGSKFFHLISVHATGCRCPFNNTFDINISFPSDVIPEAHHHIPSVTITQSTKGLMRLLL